MEHAAVPSAVREQRLNHWIEAYADDVIKVCYISLSDRAQAEDAMQETFLKAWKSMAAHERKGVTNDKAWLLRIAVNVCRDYFRTGWFRHVDSRKSIDELPIREEAAEGGDRELAMDIQNLPFKYKQIILLYYYQGLNLREAAEALGISPATAQRQLKKAEALLKAGLTGGDWG